MGLSVRSWAVSLGLRSVCVRCPRAGATHSLGVGTVGAEGQGEGRSQDAQLPDHLLHTPERSLFIRVGELDHQAGGSSL